jgi:NAD(P)-dependent dehydrogenase (short-subunit alcohol dehydrogenase family)
VSELRFDGRVAVVTGAGRGLGRAYARLLAERGAKVVVNDLGGGVDGEGADSGPAEAVARDIVAAGGQAVGDGHDVSTPDGAQAIVDTAIECFGRIDILVNNAGIVRWAGLPDVDLDNVERHLAVHLAGSFHTTRAAWPRVVEQNYGRVVLTTSSGLFGMSDNLGYAAAKAGVVGLARSAKLAGQPHGIKVNLIAPAAQTRMAGGEEHDRPLLSPDAAAPMVALLAHDSCPVSGEIYTAGGGRVARLFIASTEGYAHPTATPTMEDVAEHWDVINDERGYTVPTDTMAWSRTFLRRSPRE